jgi:hypothetical protein
MADFSRDIEDLIRIITGFDKHIPVKFCNATVTEVDESNRTCLVDSADDGKINFEGKLIRLMPEVSDGELDIPEVDSTVTVLYSDTIEPIIIRASWLKSKEIIIGDQRLKIEIDKQTWNDGNYGGWIKSIDPDNSKKGLLARLNEIEKQHNQLKTDFDNLVNIFNSHIHITTATIGTGGPGTIAPTTTTGQSSTAKIDPVTERADIENEKITHGLKYNP